MRFRSPVSPSALNLRPISMERSTIPPPALIRHSPQSPLLFRVQIQLDGLDGGVTEQQLDLFEIAAGLAAEFRAGAAQVVRSKLAWRGLLGIGDDQRRTAFWSAIRLPLMGPPLLMARKT